MATESPPPLHLASGSPRRRDILRGLGLAFSTSAEALDERRLPEETAAAMVRRLAHAKAAAAQAKRPECAILGSDTAVVLGDRVLGKPASAAEAADMLAVLSGCRHEVLTGVALCWRDASWYALATSRVRFRDISPAEAAAYWASGEPRDKAGGYAVQGLGAVFVAELHGSPSGVIGLPVFETAALLRNVGIEVLS